MEELNKKHKFLHDLADTITIINKLRQNALSYDCAALQLENISIEKSIQILNEDREETKKELIQNNKQVKNLQVEKEYLENQLNDYREKDVGGLVRQEKDLSKNMEQAKGKLETLRSRLDERQYDQKNVINELQTHQDKLKKELSMQLRGHSALTSSLPFAITGLLTALDEALHAEELEQKINELPTDHYLQQAREAKTELHKNEVNFKNSLDRNQKIVKELTDEIKKLEAIEEAVPDVNAFSEVAEELKNSMIEATPVYHGLEWNPAISKETMAQIEELIGDEIFSIFVVPEQEFEKAAEIVFQDFPGIRLSKQQTINRGSYQYPAWIREVFDISESDPYCLITLAEEMSSGKGPEFSQQGEASILKFRSHERSLFDNPARLVGSETRRREQDRLLQERNEELQDVRQEGKELKEEIKKNNEKLEIINKFIKLLEQDMKKVHISNRLIDNCRTKLNNLHEWMTEESRQTQDLNTEIERNGTRLKELRLIISKEDLDKVEQKIQQMLQKIKKVNTLIEEALAFRGQLQQRILTFDNSTEEKSTELKNNQEEFFAATQKLQEIYPEISNPLHYITEIRMEAGFRTAQYAKRAANKCREQELQIQGGLRERINEPIYGFTYDADSNELFDRNSRNIFDIQQALQKDIGEQQEIINEKTSELFRKIIVDELVKFLQAHIFNLESMVSKINELLESRWFGKNQYRFQITPVKQYERFVRIIRKYNYFDQKSEEELRNYFEDYKAEIIDTEIYETPAVLDYRNWFHYEMKVLSANNDGRIMDRHMKSIGSGGEQAVPNYLLILTIAHFLYKGSNIRLYTLLFDEAFYGIDAGRRDQLMGFANDLGLQLFVASPDQDGVKREISYSTSLFIVKDENYDVHLYPFYWQNPETDLQGKLFDEDRPQDAPIEYGEELKTEL